MAHTPPGYTPRPGDRIRYLNPDDDSGLQPTGIVIDIVGDRALINWKSPHIPRCDVPADQLLPLTSTGPTDPARTPIPATLADELGGRRRDATFAHRLAQRVVAGVDLVPADQPDKPAATANRTATEPPEGQLIWFHTRAQGAVIGARFGGWYCSATSTDTWSAHFVTGWDPVLVLPDTEATVTRLVIAISEEVAAEWAQRPKDHPASYPRAVQAALRKVAV